MTIAATICRRFEGFEKKLPDGRFTAYLCPAGIWSIGLGSTGPDIKRGLIWTESQCEERFAADLAKFEKGVKELVTVPLNAAELGALTSFAYNVGLGALQGSTLRKKLNAGDREGAADEFLKWDKGTVGGKKVTLAGLTKRRAYERSVFLGEVTP